MSVMNPYLPEEDLHSKMLDEMINVHKIAGGQNSDGSQKDGFLKYERNRPVAIFDVDKGKYVPVSELEVECNAFLGNPPDSLRPWKTVIGDQSKEDYFREFFPQLLKTGVQGAELAVKYFKRSKEIGKKLVTDGVAQSEADVNTVLLTGFFHAYGPINDYLG